MDANLILLKASDVAQTLGISKSMAYRLMQTILPTVKFGRSVRVRIEDLDRFILDSVVIHDSLHLNAKNPVNLSKISLGKDIPVSNRSEVGYGQ